MMPSSDQLILVVIIITFSVPHSQSINLSDEALKLVQEIISDFNNNPTDGKFDSVIVLPSGKSAILPKVFIWCPVQHFNLPLVCPVHKIPFFVSPFGKASKANLRMVYDIGGNVVVVQSVYRCPKPFGSLKMHKYLSAAPEVLETLAPEIVLRLPLSLHHKSGFSSALIDYLIVHICQGQTMQEIAEGIGSLHFREFVRRSAIVIGEVLDNFHTNPLYSFPSNDKLMHVFLWYFRQKKASYRAHTETLSGTTIVCDSSFSLGKRVTIKGPDDKTTDGSEMSFDGMFIALNEQGQIIEWKLDKFMPFEHKLQALKQVKERLEKRGNEISIILDPNCCQSRTKYNALFPDVQIKMGIVHALQKVAKCLPKEHPDTLVFLHKFNQIFNEDSVNNARSEPTPSPDVIEANLNVLLHNLKGTLSEELRHVLDDLRLHIRLGCLSGVPAGEGTEKIENLHRFMQKSYLSNLTVITPEMAIAVLTCLFYTWNSKKSIQSFYKGKGHKPLPLVPVEEFEVISSKKSQATPLDEEEKDKNKAEMVIQTTDGGPDSPVLVITADVIKYMISRLIHIGELVQMIRYKFKNKAFEVVNFPIFSSHRCHTVELNANPPDSPEKEKNASTLRQNLLDFGLEIDKVPGDGNCLFGSLVLQVSKASQSCADLSNHLKSIGLGKALEDDVKRLREACVQELHTNLTTYKEWIGIGDKELKGELEKFKADGFFASDIGDLCIKACVNVLQVPVIVVTSLPNSPYYPFLPVKFTTAHPVYVAFNHSSPGHYDGTKEHQYGIPGQQRKKCNCGKNAGSNSPVCAVGELSHCPCAKAGLKCLPFCRCSKLLCSNKAQAEDVSCSCGITSGSKKDFVACSKTATRGRCPCIKAGFPCTSKCACGSCGNDKPVDETVEEPEEPADPSAASPARKRRKRSSFALGAWGGKTDTALKSENSVPGSDSWTDLEVICIMVCREVLEGCKVEASVHNISQIYRYLASSPNLETLGLKITTKDDTQILAKLLTLQAGQQIVDLL
ncbi:uncharacterized protein LOC5514795 isoform X2 [Nematostella vectensis]|nr:uncharacterized protein LOC5514795 isoform X2 [Nematostella vectensis]